MLHLLDVFRRSTLLDTSLDEFKYRMHMQIIKAAHSVVTGHGSQVILKYCCCVVKNIVTDQYWMEQLCRFDYLSVSI